MQKAHKTYVKSSVVQKLKTVSNYAVYLYDILSEDIHGSMWTTNVVQISNKLNPVDRQFLEALCKEMGLIT